MTKNKKVPLIIIISIAAAAVIAAVILIAVNANSGGSGAKQQETTAVQTTSDNSSHPIETGQPTTAAQQTTAQQTTVQTGTEHDHDHDDETEPATIEIALPTSGGEISYFSGTYVPDSKAEDMESGKAVPMRELFGAGYTKAEMKFDENGGFTDSLFGTGAKAGKYTVEDGEIKAVYLPDETMDITVTEWNESTGAPVAFCVVYKTVGERGYRVFFREKQ